jgi:lipopolysaccharide export system protein LptA
MIRRFLLAVISLAILFAMYQLYNMFFGLSIAPEATNSEKTEKMVLRHTVSQPVRNVAALNSPETAVVSGEGDKAYFERYEKGQLVYQFRSESWKPADPKMPKLFDLEKPEFRLFMRSGQILHISADEGQIEASAGKKSQLEPKRGELRGKIHIYIDRGTDPKRGPAELRPDDIVHIWLHRVRFDLENCRIDTDDPINIESEEAQLFGEGLTITWNDATNQVEEITVRKGEKLVLFYGADMIGIQMPGAKADRNKKADSTESSQDMKDLTRTAAGREVTDKFLVSHEAVSKARFNPDELQMNETDRSGPTTTSAPTTQPKKRINRAYNIGFTSDVVINQYDGNKITGKMTCDRLNVILDMPKGSENQALTSRPAEKKEKKNNLANGKRLEIFWQGPLEIKPEVLPYSPTRRFHVIASGQTINIDQMEQGSVRCKKVTYFEESKQLWLDGTLDEPVNISQGANRTIVAAHLFFDRKAGTATGTGPGFMQDRAGERKNTQAENANITALSSLQSGGQKMKVLWNDGFTLNFLELKDDKQSQPYIKYAEFRGNARMEGSGMSMAGDYLSLSFLDPMPGDEVSSGKIDTLHAKQNVLLKSDEQRITCESLDVNFVDGRTPKLAIAKGNVQAAEGRRVIRADELHATMGARSKEETKQEKTPGKKSVLSDKSRVIIREVEATGNVLIRDPGQKLRVDSRLLQAKFDADRTIRWCYLEGLPNDWAMADLPNDYHIAGEKISMDLRTEQIDVPGPGNLRFASTQDIEGTHRSKVYINVQWADSMKMTGGEKNQGTFFGPTTVNSDFTTLYCGQLTIDFDNAAEPAKEEKNQEKNTGWNLSRFSELVGMKKKTDDIKLPITRKRPTFIQAKPEDGKRISIVYARRDNGALENRTTLWGNELSVDLVANRMNIPGAGILQIEDFAKANKAVAETKIATAKIAPQDPFNSSFKRSGPSWTVFTWKNGLTYLLDTKTAIFDGTVNMRHMAGGDIYNPATGSFDLKGKKPKRETTMVCENLKVEFVNGAFGAASDKKSGAGAMDLKSVMATGSVHLQDKPRSIIAPELSYSRADKMIVVRGTDDSPAYLYEEKQETGQYMMWEGPLIIWDQSTDEIQAPGASITTTMQ